MGYVIIDNNGNQLKRFIGVKLKEVVHYIIIHNWNTLTSNIKVLYKCKDTNEEKLVDI